MVYKIDETIAETLLYTTANDLLPDEMLLMDWDTVTSMDITLDGKTYTLVRTTETVSSEDGSESEQTVWTLDGEEVDGASLTGCLDNLASSGYATGITPEHDEEIRLLIRREHDTFPEVELVLYRYNSESCMVTLNGTATVFIPRTDVVTLVEEIHSIV